MFRKVCIAFVTLVAAFAGCFVASERLVQAQDLTQEERAVLQAQYDELQKEIAVQQQIIKDTQAKKNTLQGDVTLLNAKTVLKDESLLTDRLMMKLWKRKNLQAVVLKLSKESAKKRLIARGRVDDAKDEALNSRFAWYEEHVVPSIEELRACGWEIIEIDGEPDVEHVHKNILAALKLQ